VVALVRNPASSRTAELAEQAGVALSTVKRIEARPGLIQSNTRTAWQLQKAVEDAGIEFIEDDGFSGAGVRLRTASGSQSTAPGER
jgi:hypothetical protein